MRRLILLLNTIRYLKVSQLAYQVYYRVRKPRLKDLPEPVLRNKLKGWPGSAFLEPATSDGETFTFLGEVARFDGNWNNPTFPKLWLYNLHYQDDLNATGAESRAELCARMVDYWIDGNPTLRGNGWEPYCLSLRIVNWVKFFSRLQPEEIQNHWLHSLTQQAHALEQQLELHILANHLFANAKALVFAGAYLGGVEGDRWLRKGLALLDKEVPEQFLNDGAHYERSPMYQATLLWDLADLITLSRTTQLLDLQQRVGEWQQHYVSGFEWLIAMTHPDGGPSFFNDATFGIAPTVKDLEQYGCALGLPISNKAQTKNVQGMLLQESGYGVVDWPAQHCLISDLAPVGPKYQPGHAHADTLSCELSLFGQRVLVNSGISQYGEDAERHRQRSTSAHNTVEVDNENSSEVWAGFRVARRAKPFEIGLRNETGKVKLWGSHDGYQRLPGAVIHRRCWSVQNTAIEITDELTGTFKQASAHWHLHPDVIIKTVSESQFKMELPDGQCVFIEVLGGETKVVATTWHPGFGVVKSTRKLVVTFEASNLTTRISWSSD